MTERNETLEKPMTSHELQLTANALRWEAHNGSLGVLHDELMRIADKMEYQAKLLKDGVVCP